VKIGVVLSSYPAPSEPFIGTFLNHFPEHSIYLFARVTDACIKPANWILKPYINYFPSYNCFLNWLLSVFSIPFYWKRFLTLYRKGNKLKQIIADAQIWTTPCLDILHFPFANLAFGREHYAEILGARMSISFRGSDINVFPVYHSKTYSSIWSFVDAVHCNSKELAEKLNEHKIPLGIPISIIPAALRSELDAPLQRVFVDELTFTDRNPLIIVTIGRLHWVKDYPFALRVMSKLKKSGVKFRYYILGDGADKEQLLFIRKELNLEVEVILTGKVTASEISYYLKKAHIYLQTSYAEGFSNACLEAQAFGIPCVVPAISGMDVCVEHQKTGMVVEARDEQLFSDYIKYVINNPQVFNNQYISSRIKTNFSKQKQRDAWRTFFNNMGIKNQF
jgi:colanic acid/amylovoran biosynthesis glycosyltransferase